MPQDGTVINSIVHELSQKIKGGRIDKITQPEPDEIILSIRANGANHKLLLTAQSTAPRLHLTEVGKISPLTAPMFCMVLRKHISSGHIIDICQPGFERIVELHIDAINEMGDRAVKILLIEIMGKHSNIMLLNPQTGDAPAKVIDAVKHVPPSVSAVRAILPGSIYSRPPGEKKSPLNVNQNIFEQVFAQQNISIQQALFKPYTGISPILASEICVRANIPPDTFTGEVNPEAQAQLYRAFSHIFGLVQAGDFMPHIYFDQQGKAVDITALSFAMYSHLEGKEFSSPSSMQEVFFAKRDADYRVSQKTADLRKLVTTLHERSNKKAFMYEKTLADIESRDDLRIKGELLTAYMHQIKQGDKSIILENFYDDNKSIEIPLDPNLSPTENAQRFFKQYNKQKRTFTALQEQIAQNQGDQTYLDSVALAMETVTTEADIAEIRAELAEGGFAKRKYARVQGKKGPGQKTSKKSPAVSKPLRFTSSDGFELYVGKNNTQNDHLTLRQAKNHDIWLHTKDIAGSHVIIITGGVVPPESTIMEAANLAAYYSKGRNSSQVPVDYVQRKYVRKPNGAKPGFVIYDRHKTIYVSPVEPSLS
ncbi:MAG: NFACT family protein [Defluviitaleaceae bacterium]|nr:NFACT family protein [Defluviitaleaceae bacterium]